MKKLFILAAALTCVATTSAQAPKDSLLHEEIQEVVVKGVRVQKNAPFAVANIKKAELRQFSKSGQELPFLFARTPGILAWSENGMGTGTTYMRIRGAAGSRINVTLDGVALNSPEDQTVFWANMNSYAALLGSVQIQRGVGASTNGDGAFGGSVSLATAAPSQVASLELTGSYGSYNTYNIGLNFSSGMLRNHWILSGAYHETATDGFLHGTSGRSGSYFGGLAYYAGRLTLAYKNIGNFEKTGQAWNGVTAGNDDATLMGNAIRTYKDMYHHGLGRFNPLYEGIVFDEDRWQFPQDARGNFITRRYAMQDGSLWRKTTDNFYQNHNILSAVWRSGSNWTHNAALHYTYGYGYYSEFRPNNKFAKFGLTATDAAGNKIKRTDFVRRKGLAQHTYGLVYNLNYSDGHKELTGGINLQQFRGSHFGYLTYVKDKGQTQNFTGKQYYDSNARKDDYSAFVKGTLHAGSYLDFFADIQYRHVGYKTSGINDKFVEQPDGTYKNQQLDIDADYNFVNPKAGITFHSGAHKAYASASYASREPERNNFTDNGNYPAPDAEHLLDFELGYDYTGSNWVAGINLYSMHYRDQFVQTGMKSDIGENLTTNIDKSFRMGVELSASWSPLAWLTLEGNAALSRNKVKDFTEYIDDWDNPRPKDYDFKTQSAPSNLNWKPTTAHYDRSVLAFSPSALLNGIIDFHHRGFQAMWHTNFVSRQYLDNTADKLRSLPCFSQSNLHLGYTTKTTHRTLGIKEVALGLDLVNLFGRRYAASGWVYSAVSAKNKYTPDNRYYQIGFIPMAGFTCMSNITLRF